MSEDLIPIKLLNTAAEIFVSHQDGLDYFLEVQAGAAKLRMLDQFYNKLRYLAEYACQLETGIWDYTLTRCVLHKDFAPLSFDFAMQRYRVADEKGDGKYEYWFNGGLIFHGAHDGHGSGSFPTLAVTLNPTTGWSVHT